MKLLAGAVVKKRPAESQDTSPKRQKTEPESDKKPNGAGDNAKECSKRSRSESEGTVITDYNFFINPSLHQSLNLLYFIY